MRALVLLDRKHSAWALVLFSADQQTNYLCLRPNYLCLRLSCVVFFFLGICSTVLTQYALNGGIVHKYFWCLGGTLVCKQAHFWRSGFKGNPSVRALQIFGRGGTPVSQYFWRFSVVWEGSIVWVKGFQHVWSTALLFMAWSCVRGFCLGSAIKCTPFAWKFTFCTSPPKGVHVFWHHAMQTLRRHFQPNFTNYEIVPIVAGLCLKCIFVPPSVLVAQPLITLIPVCFFPCVGSFRWRICLTYYCQLDRTLVSSFLW